MHCVKLTSMSKAFRCDALSSDVTDGIFTLECLKFEHLANVSLSSFGMHQLSSLNYNTSSNT